MLEEWYRLLRSNPARERSAFEVLVRHLLARFLQNEWTVTEDDTNLIAQISVAMAVPGLLVALLLFPAYHGFPPYPAHRYFWDEVGDHYFYVLDSFVVMAAVALFEWDLLFPDLTDIYVLGILPISARRLFTAKVFSGMLFFSLVLVGANLFGIAFLPALVAQKDVLVQVYAHGCAVLMAGMFAACAICSLQGAGVVLLGARRMSQIGPIVQALLAAGLLSAFLLLPAITQMIRPAFLEGRAEIWYFPPFWFLGTYEHTLNGTSTIPVFVTLDQIAQRSTVLSILFTLLTFPLAYMYRVKATTEGGQVMKSRSMILVGVSRMFDRYLLRSPGQKAIAHFTLQSAARLARPRVTLAMYTGLGVALALAHLVSAQPTETGVDLVLYTSGSYAVIPTICFWVVAGMANIIDSSTETKASWIFRVSIGRAQATHLAGTRIVVTLTAVLGSFLVSLFFRVGSKISVKLILADFITATTCSILLTQLFLYRQRSVPFTSSRLTSISTLPKAFVKYVLAYSFFVSLTAKLVKLAESNVLIGMTLMSLSVAIYSLLHALQARSLSSSNLDLQLEDSADSPQRLGLP